MRLSAAFALIVVSSPALAVDMPARKAGLWEMKMTVDGRGVAMPAIQQCIDAATDRQMNTLGASAGSQQCAKKDVQVAGGTVTVDSVCSFGATTATSHAVVTGDFNSAYVVKVNTKRSGGAAAPGASGETNMTIEAKWLGPCKADQRPGDMIMGNGMKMNINDISKMGTPGMPGGTSK